MTKDVRHRYNGKWTTRQRHQDGREGISRQASLRCELHLVLLMASFADLLWLKSLTFVNYLEIYLQQALQGTGNAICLFTF